MFLIYTWADTFTGAHCFFVWIGVVVHCLHFSLKCPFIFLQGSVGWITELGKEERWEQLLLKCHRPYCLTEVQ